MFRIDKAPAGAQLFTSLDDPHHPAITQLHVVQCSSCGLVQLDGDAVPYYRSVISAAALSPEMRAFRTRQFRDFIKDFSLAGRPVVEIGAANGLFVDLLADTGANAVGTEGGLPDETGKTPGGQPLYRGYPELLRPLPGAPYAGFVCINFLEHAPCPADFVRSIAISLEFGAAGIIEVPAFEHMIDVDLSYDWVADHLSYFDQHSLKRAVEMCGFEVVRLERVWHAYDWAATVVRRPPVKLDQMCRSFENAVRNLKTFVAARNAQGRRVAIWGASHQALTLLTECSFGVSEVPFIIDSALFKQGTRAPGCGLPVVAPKLLMESGVDCVLIMAAGYSLEIARQLRDAWGFAGEAAIFRGEDEPQPVGP